MEVAKPKVNGREVTFGILTHLDHMLTAAEAFRSIFQECQRDDDFRKALAAYVPMDEMRYLATLHRRLTRITESATSTLQGEQQ